MVELFPRNEQTTTSDLIPLSTVDTETTGAASATVLVAVHKPPVREALVAAIEAIDGFEVIGEAGTEDEAVSLARRLHPTIALVDEDLPSCCGAWTIQTLADEQLASAIVGIGLRGNGGVRARFAGADAYLQTGHRPTSSSLRCERRQWRPPRGPHSLPPSH